MIYKIQNSLGNASAILVDSITSTGICIEFKSFEEKDASIIVYVNGKPQDLSFNGLTFPCVYNNIICHQGSDVYGGRYSHIIEFDFLAPDGSVNKIIKKIYGAKESLAIEYFFSLLYNISCCANIVQYEQLYGNIIDNKSFAFEKNKDNALAILSFIEEFAQTLANVRTTLFLSGLKQKISAKYKEAQEIILMSNGLD